MNASKTRATKLIVVCLLAFFLHLSFTNSAHAETHITIKKGQIEKIADFGLKYRANAGGTLTKKYYVFPDNQGKHGGKIIIWVVDRNTCKTVSHATAKVSYLSGLYNKWGSSHITLIAKGKQVGCFKLNGSKIQKSSGCSTPPTRTLSYQGTGQGNTATFNGYTFKVAGYHGGKIGVWNSSGSRVATAIIPRNVVDYEPENIDIDGETGEVYINYARKANGKRYSMWYKIDSSVFSKYTGKKGHSNPTICKGNEASESSSSSSSDNPSSVIDNPADPSSGYTPTDSTYDGVIDTIFFGTIRDDGKGCGVYTVLDLVFQIMTIGVGVLAVLGITISGITYLTAGGDVAKTTKAKRRIYEIVIGLVAYAALWAILTFLLPEFNPELKTCQAASVTADSQQYENFA